MNTNTKPNPTETRKCIAQAFTALRKAGIFARQNYLCCHGCAANAALASIAKLPKAKRAATKGVVFYHSQCEENLRAGNDVMVYFSATNGCKTNDVGTLAATALRAAGLRVAWDGTDNTALRVKQWLQKT